MGIDRGCIIEAGTVLCRVEADGRMQLMHDAGIVVKKGMIVEIGAVASVGAKPGSATLRQRTHCRAIGARQKPSSFRTLMMGVPFAPLELWLPRFRAMRQVDVRLDTLYSAIEMLESGTTTVHHIDMSDD